MRNKVVLVGACFFISAVFPVYAQSSFKNPVDSSTPQHIWLMPQLGDKDRQYLTGDWGGWRSRLAERGMTMKSTLVSDILSNPVGGKRKNRARYNQSLGLDLNFDLEKISSLKGLQFHLSGVYRQGRNLSKDIGNQFTVSSIYGSQQIRLYGLYFDQSLLEGKFDFRIGRLAAGDDFASSSLYWYYVNNAIDGNPVSLPLNFPFSAYPTAVWGMRAKMKPVDRLQLMTGIYSGDGSVGRNEAHGMDFSLRLDRGILFLQEFRYLSNQEEGDTGLPGNYKLGLYYHTGKFDDLYKDANGNSYIVSGLPQNQAHGNYGLYLHLDQLVYREDTLEGAKIQGLLPFLVFTLAPDYNSKFPIFVDGGLLYRGLVPGRDEDVSMFGFAYGKWSNALESSQRDDRDTNSSGLDPQEYELMFELSYKMQLRPWFFVQPDIQWIVNPGGRGDIDDALVTGTRIGFVF